MAQRNHIPAVEQSIVNVLIERGFDIAKGRALFDQAHDYGEMWGVKEKLLQDIAEQWRHHRAAVRRAEEKRTC